MRRPKHRHHPDIWRERHREEQAWLTRWLAKPPPTEEQMRRFVLRAWGEAVDYDRAVFSELAPMFRLQDRIAEAVGLGTLRVPR